MASIYALIGACSTKKKDMGFQFQQKANGFSAGGSFIPGDVTDVVSGGAASLNGNFLIGQSFKCRGCGNKHLYQCGSCGKFICYDGAAQNAECPACGASGFVPAETDERIVVSGGAAKKKILLVMDISASMDETTRARTTRLAETKQAAVDEFVRKIPSAEIALVTFGTSVKTVLGFTEDKAKMERAIGALKVDGGTTSPFKFIKENYSSFLESGESGRYIVIFTDGAWAGKTEGHISSANKMRSSGVKIITIGCGGADAAFLGGIATPGANITAADGAIKSGFASASSMLLSQ